MDTPIGLPNIGATCYFNSVRQALLSCPSYYKSYKEYSFEDFMSKHVCKYALGQPYDSHDCLMDIESGDLLYGENTCEYIFPNGKEETKEKRGSFMLYGDFSKLMEDTFTCDSFREFHIGIITKRCTTLPQIVTIKNVLREHIEVPTEFQGKQLRAILYYVPGHYFAYVLRGQDWYIIDDDRIVKLNPDQHITHPPDIMFYE